MKVAFLCVNVVTFSTYR